MAESESLLEEIRAADAWYFRDPEKALALGRDALDVPGARTELRTAALALISRSSFVRGELDAARTRAVECLDLYEDGRLDDDKIGMFLVIGAVDRRQGRLADAVSWVRRALDVAEETGNVDQNAVSHNNLGLIYLDLGDHDAAYDLFTKGLELTEHVSAELAGNLTASLHNNVGLILIDRGAIERSVEHFENAVRLARGLGQRRQELRFLRNLANQLTKLGRFEEANRELERLMLLCDELGDVGAGLATAEQTLGTMLAAQDRPEEAVAHFDRAAEILREVGEVRPRVTVLNLAARAYRQLGDATRAEQRAREAVAACEEFTDNRATVRTLDALAELCAEKGGFEEAFSLLKRAQQVRAKLSEARLKRQLSEQQARLDVVWAEQEARQQRERSEDLERQVAERTTELRAAQAVDAEEVPFSLEELANELVARATPGAELNGNKLVLELGQISGPIVSDRRLLGEAAFLLLENAAKFTRDGTIRLRIEMTSAESVALIAIEDTGIGMDEEDIARVFEPFRQRDESYTRTFGGLGLGLSLCRRYCEVLGGTLSVESSRGSGSSFSIRIG